MNLVSFGVFLKLVLSCLSSCLRNSLQDGNPEETPTDEQLEEAHSYAYTTHLFLYISPAHSSELHKN